MKYFIKVVLLFLFPIFVIGAIGEVLLRSIPNDYAKKRMFLDINSNDVEVLILGSSHSYYGINPQFMHIGRAYNAAYVSQSLDYDYAILNRYADNWRNLKYIILPIDYFSLFQDLKNSFQRNSYNIYFQIKGISNFFDNFEVLGNQFKLNLTRLYRHYVKDISASTSSNYGWGTDFTDQKSMSLESLDEAGAKSAARHKKTNSDYLQQEINNLNLIIAFAEKRNIDVLLFTTPCYQSYVSNLDKNQLDSTIKIVSNIAKLHSNTKYINYLNDSSFTFRDYFNPDHLNWTGAKKLTKKLEGDLISF